MFLFQSYLEGFAWLRSNLWIASAIIIGGLVWILLLALLSQTISAVVKWRIVASGVMLGVVFIPSAFAGIVNILFQTHWANIISLSALMWNITAGLFGTFDRIGGRIQVTDFDDNVVREVLLMEPPLWASWAALFIFCAICLAILHWKVKAYEVVR
jgi:hypothetical protein